MNEFLQFVCVSLYAKLMRYHGDIINDVYFVIDANDYHTFDKQIFQEHDLI